MPGKSTAPSGGNANGHARRGNANARGKGGDKQTKELGVPLQDRSGDGALLGPTLPDGEAGVPVPGGGVFVVEPEGSADISFRLLSNVSNVPTEQSRLREDIERALMVLRGLRLDHGRLHSHFQPLLSLSRAGLTGRGANPSMASKALLLWKKEVVDAEGARIKNQYMTGLGVWALVLTVIGLGSAHLAANLGLALEAHLIVMAAAAAPGVWLSFGIRKRTLRFEELHVLEEDRLAPAVRVVFVAVLTVALGLIFTTGILTVSLGSLSTSAVATSYVTAGTVGLLAGIMEQALPGQLENQAGALLKDPG